MKKVSRKNFIQKFNNLKVDYRHANNYKDYLKIMDKLCVIYNRYLDSERLEFKLSDLYGIRERSFLFDDLSNELSNTFGTTNLNEKEFRKTRKLTSELNSLTQVQYSHLEFVKKLNNLEHDFVEPVKDKNAYRTITKGTVGEILKKIDKKYVSKIKNIPYYELMNTRFTLLFTHYPTALQMSYKTINFGGDHISHSKKDKYIEVTDTHRIPAKSALYRAVKNFYAHVAGDDFGNNAVNFINYAKGKINGLDDNFGKYGLTSIYWKSSRPLNATTGKYTNDRNIYNADLLNGSSNGNALIMYKYFTNIAIYNQYVKPKLTKDQQEKFMHPQFASIIDSNYIKHYLLTCAEYWGKLVQLDTANSNKRISNEQKKEIKNYSNVLHVTPNAYKEKFLDTLLDLFDASYNGSFDKLTVNAIGNELNDLKLTRGAIYDKDLHTTLKHLYLLREDSVDLLYDKLSNNYIASIDPQSNIEYTPKQREFAKKIMKITSKISDYEGKNNSFIDNMDHINIANDVKTWSKKDQKLFKKSQDLWLQLYKLGVANVPEFTPGNMTLKNAMRIGHCDFIVKHVSEGDFDASQINEAMKISKKRTTEEV